MVKCDGCGQEANGEHLRVRVERLEMATRFRPIHIHTLVVGTCPPAEIADYFYNVAQERGPRSDLGRAGFAQLALCAPDASAKADGAAANEEAVLIEWQRRGFFLATAVDCPIEPGAALDAAIRDSAKTLILRLNTSYRPKHVALVGGATKPLIAPLEASGWQGKLLLDRCAPFDGPAFGEKLAAAIYSA
jgi:hypothetical protein